MPKGRYSREETGSNNRGLIAFIALLVLFVISMSFLTFIWNWDIVIDTNELPSEVAYGEHIEKPSSRVIGKLFYKNGFEIETKELSSDDTSEIGHKYFYYQAEWFIFKKTVCEDVYVYDKTPPTITLSSNEVVIDVNDKYIDDGFTATDEYDGDLTNKVKSIEAYDKIIYYVSDSSGNYAFAERKLIREQLNKDETSPIINISGNSRLVIELGSEYSDKGATAEDDVDGNLNDKIIVNHNVNTEKIGSYVVEYFVEDSSGNEATATRIVDVVEKYENNANGKVIYLTFDDGPSQYTNDLLKVLKKYNIKATFFVLGNAGSHSIYKDIVDGGHSIGIHGINHTYSKLYSSDEYFIDNLKSMQNIIEEQTGVKTYLMRFPGGSSNTVSKNYNKGIMTRLSQKVEELGFVYFDWNVDSDDAGKAKDEKTVFKNVKNGVERCNGSAVVLQHDVKDFSVNAVEEIILWGISNGYVFKALDMDSPTAHHPINN